MKPAIRRSGLIVHVIASVGWLGAVIAYLALTLRGLTSTDVEVVRGTYPAMATIGWWVIVPLCLISFVSGLIQSAITEWGLFRHCWIVVKLGLTVVSTGILFAHMPMVSRVAASAASMTLPVVSPDVARTQLLVHAAGGLVVLAAITAISIAKPWGLIRWGRL